MVGGWKAVADCRPTADHKPLGTLPGPPRVELQAALRGLGILAFRTNEGRKLRFSRPKATVTLSADAVTTSPMP